MPSVPSRRVRSPSGEVRKSQAPRDKLKVTRTRIRIVIRTSTLTPFGMESTKPLLVITDCRVDRLTFKVAGAAQPQHRPTTRHREHHITAHLPDTPSGRDSPE